MNVPVILVGGLRSLDVMQKILDSTKIELLSLSRPLLREPDFPEKLREGKCSESECISCNVHVEADKDFSQAEQITHTGALLIGTYDRFTYGDPAGFLRNIFRQPAKTG